MGLAPAMPNWRDLFAWVDVSSVFDWSTIVQWYRGLSVGRSIPTQGVNDVVRRLTGGASGTGEVISRLYDYVSNKINYEDLSFQYSAYVPQKPESVISDGFGDCKDKCALLVAMLRSAGIDAWMALSDPSYHGTGTFLQSTRFSHTIVVVPKAGPGGSDLLLDPTYGYFTYPELPPSLTGTWYLPIPPVSELAAELRRIEAGGQQIATEIFAEVEVGVTGTNVRASAVMHGVHAAEVRAILQSDDAEIRRTEFSLLVAQGIPGFKLARLHCVQSRQRAHFACRRLPRRSACRFRWRHVTLASVVRRPPPVPSGHRTGRCAHHASGCQRVAAADAEAPDLPRLPAEGLPCRAASRRCGLPIRHCAHQLSFQHEGRPPRLRAGSIPPPHEHRACRPRGVRLLPRGCSRQAGGSDQTRRGGALMRQIQIARRLIPALVTAASLVITSCFLLPMSPQKYESLTKPPPTFLYDDFEQNDGTKFDPVLLRMRE